ncbi:MAG: ankyrin repeat domain-containing protein [Holosporales bacterium]|jgi:hypothetical protein|nr:ankyrin repeat domain-containing protein [Holosporales bacterium]
MNLLKTLSIALVLSNCISAAACTAAPAQVADEVRISKNLRFAIKKVTLPPGATVEESLPALKVRTYVKPSATRPLPSVQAAAYDIDPKILQKEHTIRKGLFYLDRDLLRGETAQLNSRKPGLGDRYCEYQSKLYETASALLETMDDEELIEPFSTQELYEDSFAEEEREIIEEVSALHERKRETADSLYEAYKGRTITEFELVDLTYDAMRREITTRFEPEIAECLTASIRDMLPWVETERWNIDGILPSRVIFITGPGIRQKDSASEEVLEAAWKGDVAKMRELAAAGAATHFVVSCKRPLYVTTPFMEAITHGRLEMVKLFLDEFGESVNLTCENKAYFLCPLERARESEQTLVEQELLRRGARIPAAADYDEAFEISEVIKMLEGVFV